MTPRGRAGRRAPDAPAASRARKGSTSAHEYSQRRHRKTRPSRTRWSYCLCRALLGEVLYCARPLAEDGLSHPVGRTRLRENYPSIRGGTTRFTSPQQASFVLRNLFIGSQAHHEMGPPCQVMATRDTAASIASHSASVTIAIRPLWWNETNERIPCFEQKGNGNIFRSGAGQPGNTKSRLSIDATASRSYGATGGQEVELASDHQPTRRINDENRSH